MKSWGYLERAQSAVVRDGKAHAQNAFQLTMIIRQVS